MSRGTFGAKCAAIALTFTFLGVSAPAAGAVTQPTNSQWTSFVSQVKPIVGKHTRGWKSTQDILNRGAEICNRLASNGYSGPAISSLVKRLTPASFTSVYPVKSAVAVRVVTAAMQTLCPMPSPPPSISLPAGWVEKPGYSFSGPYDKYFDYTGNITYGTTIPIGNLTQVPAKPASNIHEIDCTGEWYAKRSFAFQLIDATGNALANNTSTNSSNDLSSCSSSGIADLNRYPTATAILIPASIPALQGLQLSGPGVSLSITVFGIEPADYCDPKAISGDYCRSGPVYFPPAS